MFTVTSNDGSRIAYDRRGSGPTVILVVGALGHRKFKKIVELARLLAEHCTVINYDRRGRGDSTEVKPFALEREIEDIQALIEAEGGSASLWGWSSGGALALRATGAGIGVERLAVYEVPFMVTPDAKRPTPDYGERLDELVAAGDRNGAVKHFMRNAIGIPAPFVALMRPLPMWKELEGRRPHPPLRLGRARRAHDVRRAAPGRGVGLGHGADARRLRRQEPGRAEGRLPGAGAGAAERAAARARGRQPQREDERAGAGGGGLHHGRDPRRRARRAEARNASVTVRTEPPRREPAAV